MDNFKPAPQSARGLYILGAVSALLAVAGNVLDMVIASFPNWGPEATPAAAMDWLIRFQANPWIELYHLDLLNVLIAVFFIPAFLALAAAHWRANPGFAALGLVVFVIATTVFMANNAALPMLDLSQKFAAAADADKLMLVAAAETLLAKGAHGSPGVFWGFAFSLIANLVISGVMLRAGIFPKAAAYVGIAGFTLLLIYVILVTFMPLVKNPVLVLAMPGGLLAMAWNVMIAIQLFRLREV